MWLCGGGFGRPRSPRDPSLLNNLVNLLDSLNSDPTYDLTNCLNTFLSSLDDSFEDINLWSDINIDCKYYDDSSLIERFSGLNNPLVLNANIQSLSSKHDKLSEMIKILENENVIFDVIALQETWEIKDVKSLSLPGYHELIFKNRSSARGGGIGFYIKNTLNYKVIDELSIFNDRIFESLCIEVEFVKGKKMRFVTLYRPPSHNALSVAQQTEAYFESLEILLTQLNAANHETIILTDSNFDLLSLNTCSTSSKYFNCILSHGFYNVINKSTYFSKESSSLIDHIITNSPASSFTSGVITQDISDHCFTFVKINTKKRSQTVRPRSYRSFSDSNLSNFYDSLGNIGWGDVYDSQQPEEAFNIFWDLFSTFFNLHFPIKKANFNRNFHKLNNFMTTGLLNSRRNKLELYKSYLADKSDHNYLTYKRYRNLYNKLLKASKKLYFETEINKNQKDPKAMWKLLNESINRSSSKSCVINEINVNGLNLTDPTEMANEFNIFFSQIAHKIRSTIPETSTSPDSYTTPRNPTFEFHLCSPEIINEIILSLETKTSLDIDNVNTKVLKKVSNLISSPLAHIFNLSLQQGILPERLKTSRTVPVFKEGLQDKMSNYRPISCLPTMSKIIEKFVAKQLYEFISANGILYDYQFGFQPGKSTVHPLIHIVDYISKAFNNNEYAIAVFLDFQKAFDLVDHKILLKKLCDI